MLYINTASNTDKTCNYYFGLEEYLIKDFTYDGDIFLLWSVEPTVMIGRHQVTQLELDQEYVDKHNIHVVRRNSGGGAVYTDFGCLQFSFITNKKSPKDIFYGHVEHIISAIQKLGINAEFTGRNDIVVEGRKFSGNAEYINKDKMVIHGTILFDSNLDHLVGSLTPDKSKLSKHAVQSVQSRVVNIGSMIDMDIDAFYEFMVAEIATSQIVVEDLEPNKISAYAEKFGTKEWNYNKSPKYEYTNKIKFDSGLYQIQIAIKDSIVKEVKLTGDYFSLKKMTDFENAFIGKNYEYSAFLDVVKVTKVKDYIYKLKTREFLELCFGEQKKKILRKPDFLRVDMRDLNRQTKEIKALLRQHNLHTVCQEASCPNQMECFSNKTATFMILGANCTRNCRFCDVTFGNPQDVDMEEPHNIVLATKLMGLKHVVITSVTRDDLPDFGSTHFVRCLDALHDARPNVTVEVLTPDFMGDKESIKRVADALPDVYNHNVETVPRLYKGFRHNATYERSLALLRYVKELNPNILTKSGIMVGIGETKEEVLQVMDDLRANGVDIMTIGQYLQPSKKHYEVKEYVSLETFDFYKKEGLKRGFQFVASGPMVRSSYNAHEQFKGGKS